MKKVLIVDDNPDILEMVSELLAANGFQPLTASSGNEALEKVESESPDLILLDINMPDMDGWSVLRELKERKKAPPIKVIMLTATVDIGTDIFGLQDLVFDYIRKPFTNKDLAERVRKALEEEKVEEKGERKTAVMRTIEAESKRKPGFLSRISKIFGSNMEDLPLEGMEKVSDSAMMYDLRPGFGYLVKERKPVKSFEIFVDLVTHNIQGLCITRQHPSEVRKRWKLEKTPIIWLSNQVGKVCVSPTNISILSDIIVRFIEKSHDSVVLIDGVEYLIVNNDFEKVLRMIHHVLDVVMEYKSRLIITIDPRVLDDREMALLERNMEIIDTKDYLTEEKVM